MKTYIAINAYTSFSNVNFLEKVVQYISIITVQTQGMIIMTKMYFLHAHIYVYIYIHEYCPYVCICMHTHAHAYFSTHITDAYR